MGKGTMTISEVDCQLLLNDWQAKYIGDNHHYPSFLGYGNLGDKTRGITYFKGGNPRYNYSRSPSWGEIKINSRLTSDWRIKAVLWHEFCHHWAYSVYHYSGHQGTFDKCLRTDKKLWLLGSLTRIIPML